MRPMLSLPIISTISEDKKKIPQNVKLPNIKPDKEKSKIFLSGLEDNAMWYDETPRKLPKIYTSNKNYDSMMEYFEP